RGSTSLGATRCFILPWACGPKVVFAWDCVATAPTPAWANGTTAPTATNLDSTATPRSFVFGSNPTMLKVDGTDERIGPSSKGAYFPVPAILKDAPPAPTPARCTSCWTS